MPGVEPLVGHLDLGPGAEDSDRGSTPGIDELRDDLIDVLAALLDPFYEIIQWERWHVAALARGLRRITEENSRP